MPETKWLIASDLDGTLLVHGTTTDGRTLPGNVIPTLRRLQELGVDFCIASGRPIEPLQEMFSPLGDRCHYLAENGSWVFTGEKLLQVNSLPRESCEQIAALIAPRDDCVLRINTTITKYFLVRNEETAEYLRNWEFTDHVVIESIGDFSQVKGEITQMTATSFGDIYPIAEQVLPFEFPGIKGTVTGEHWLDYAATDKGIGVADLCKRIGLPLSRVIAFGDSYNDVPMLDIAGIPYIMDSAPRELLDRYPNRCRDVMETIKALEAEGFFAK